MNNDDEDRSRKECLTDAANRLINYISDVHDVYCDNNEIVADIITAMMHWSDANEVAFNDVMLSASTQYRLDKLDYVSGFSMWH